MKNFSLTLLTLICSLSLSSCNQSPMFKAHTSCRFFEMPKNILEYVDNAEHIFIGKIKDFDRLILKEYNKFEVEVIDSYKGNYDKKDKVKLLTPIGPCDAFSQEIKNEEYYLFFANSITDQIKEYKGVRGNEIYLRGERFKIKLENFDEAKPLNEQEESIQYVVNKYRNIINEALYGDNKYTEKKFSSIKEKVDYYDFIYICLFPNFEFSKKSYKENWEDYSSYLGDFHEDAIFGYGSDVLTIQPNSYVLEKIKGDSISAVPVTKIFAPCMYDYQGVKVPVNETCLVFANYNDGHYTSPSIDWYGKQVIIIDNNDQLVRLNGYVIDKPLKEQSEEIQYIVSQYTTYL